jgi:hypothetical protein
MSAFFRDQFDLYKEVMKDPVGIFNGLRTSIKAVTGEDLEADLKEACTMIREHQSYDFAFNNVDVLWNIIQDKLNVFEGEIKK